MNYFQQSTEVLQNVADQHQSTLDDIVEAILNAHRHGGTVFFCGNGGSAADSQHLATELVVRFEENREPVSAVALTTDTSLLTACANDFGYEYVFQRQVEAHVDSDDVLIAISTSGNSGNVVKAAQTAGQQSATVVGFTGQSGGELKEFCDLLFNVPSSTTSHIQEAHITGGHYICRKLEEKLLDS